MPEDRQEARRAKDREAEGQARRAREEKKAKGAKESQGGGPGSSVTRHCETQQQLIKALKWELL